MRMKSGWLLASVLMLAACQKTGNPVMQEDTTLPPQDVLSPAEAAAVSTPPAVTPPSAAGQSSADRASEPVSLNLTLPAMSWDDKPAAVAGSTLPDVFRTSPDIDRVNWSGRLHLDESEEARSRPITDNILGAEVELQVRLP